MRLSHRDYDTFQRVTLELYDHRDLRIFRQTLPQTFLGLIQADHFIWNAYSTDERFQGRLTEYVESSPQLTPDIIARMETSMPRHPFSLHLMNGGKPTALKISDFLTLTQFRNSALYAELYRQVEAQRTLAIPCFQPEGSSSINFHRRGKDFTERDRFILELVRPHFIQAHRNAKRATERRVSGVKPLAHHGLSPRETEVAGWLARGKTNPEIAIFLRISVRTVEKQVAKIIEKLDAPNRTAAALAVSNSIAD